MKEPANGAPRAREGALVFGPVPSRRLGLSLGVDLVPSKTCSYGCVYCQVGRTTALTLERREYVPISAILDAVRAKMAANVKADHVTLSGSGEPTLHSKIGGIIRGIRAATKTPVAVLTNGSLLWMPDVRRDLAEADVVLPTLAAGDEATWRAVHRPAEGLSFERVIEGMAAFREAHPGAIWLEVFLVAGLNTDEPQIRKMADVAARLAPDRIQLNTAVRPTAEKGVRAVSPEEMERMCRAFGPKAEVIADFAKAPDRAGAAAGSAEVLDMLRRRPCTAEDVAAGLSIRIQEAVEHLAALANRGLVVAELREGKRYFRATLPR